MYAIFKKEIRNYFLTPIGYIFISPFLALSAMFFVSGVTYYQTASVDYMLVHRAGFDHAAIFRGTQ